MSTVEAEVEAVKLTIEVSKKLLPQVEEILGRIVGKAEPAGVHVADDAAAAAGRAGAKEAEAAVRATEKEAAGAARAGAKEAEALKTPAVPRRGLVDMIAGDNKLLRGLVKVGMTIGIIKYGSEVIGEGASMAGGMANTTLNAWNYGGMALEGWTIADDIQKEGLGAHKTRHDIANFITRYGSKELLDQLGFPAWLSTIIASLIPDKYLAHLIDPEGDSPAAPAANRDAILTMPYSNEQQADLVTQLGPDKIKEIQKGLNFNDNYINGVLDEQTVKALQAKLSKEGPLPYKGAQDGRITPQLLASIEAAGGFVPGISKDTASIFTAFGNKALPEAAAMQAAKIAADAGKPLPKEVSDMAGSVAGGAAMIAPAMIPAASAQEQSVKSPDDKLVNARPVGVGGDAARDARVAAAEPKKENKGRSWFNWGLDGAGIVLAAATNVPVVGNAVASVGQFGLGGVRFAGNLIEGNGLKVATSEALKDEAAAAVDLVPFGGDAVIAVKVATVAGRVGIAYAAGEVIDASLNGSDTSKTVVAAAPAASAPELSPTLAKGLQKFLAFQNVNTDGMTPRDMLILTQGVMRGDGRDVEQSGKLDMKTAYALTQYDSIYIGGDKVKAELSQMIAAANLPSRAKIAARGTGSSKVTGSGASIDAAGAPALIPDEAPAKTLAMKN